MKYTATLSLLLCCLLTHARTRTSFDKDWKFLPGDDSAASGAVYNDASWRSLDLPHDWSIEGAFSKDAPAKPEGGALPTGTGWYRKSFVLPKTQVGTHVFIDFDGIYRNSEVWINGHYLGKRPSGYISFRYELTQWLDYTGRQNTIAVRVDNSAQPGSRWYSGSGIYRHVWITTTGGTAVDHWGTFVTTPKVSADAATVHIETHIRKSSAGLQRVSIEHIIRSAAGLEVARSLASGVELADSLTINVQEFSLANPRLWSPAAPNRYTITTRILNGSETLDEYVAPLGIRRFYFDVENGFFLNGKSMKILGVCLHHDLGALGAAVNKRAIERQLALLKKMGCNAIRTSHNEPAPELLDLCDSMGFLVMDEAFDMWVKKKTKADYHLYFPEWHQRDLEDQVLRDRNHPCVFMWSIGNEIPEQNDTSGITIARDLAGIIKHLDTTRPVTSALTEISPTGNNLYKSGALDVLGINYHIQTYKTLRDSFPGQKFISSEAQSALASRGHYDMPADSIRHWPKSNKEPHVTGNSDYTVSSYDNVFPYWGNTHDAGWKAVKKYRFISGLFIWTGFDYIGEPTPYPYPAHSSYFGLLDLAGFPKDAYYLYQSEWISKPVLHLLPNHWNWKRGKTVDVLAYYNNADEAELFLNGKSLGVRRKRGDDLHVKWRVKYEAGSLKAITRKGGIVVMEEEIKTAGAPARLELIADRKTLQADGRDLSFITVRVLDKDGNVVPDAANMVHFKVSNGATIAGVDNGYEASLEPFKADYRKAYNGLCLLIVQSGISAQTIEVRAESDGIESARLELTQTK